MPRASLVALSTSRRRPTRSVLASLAIHALLLAIAVVVSASVAARQTHRKVKLTFYDNEPEAEQQQKVAPPPPAPGPPPPPVKRVFVRKLAPPPDLPPADPQAATPYDETMVAPPPCTDPNGCNQNPGAPNGVVGGTGIPTAVAPPPPPPPERPRPRYLSPEMTRPRLLSGEQPHYTEQARRARVEGDIIVRIEVGADGRVGEVKIMSGLALLEQEVISKIRSWRFSVPTYRGEPCSVYLIQRITFRLEE